MKSARPALKNTRPGLRERQSHVEHDPFAKAQARASLQPRAAGSRLQPRARGGAGPPLAGRGGIAPGKARQAIQVNQYTITTRCHLTERELEYKVSFPSEEDLIAYFAGKKDRLISVSDGWGDFYEWFRERHSMRTDRPNPPHYKKNGK